MANKILYCLVKLSNYTSGDCKTLRFKVIRDFILTTHGYIYKPVLQTRFYQSYNLKCKCPAQKIFVGAGKGNISWIRHVDKQKTLLSL